ncbi:MAG: hypothetical protein ACI4CZ_09820 [Hominisplanchenecus sp.]
MAELLITRKENLRKVRAGPMDVSEMTTVQYGRGMADVSCDTNL